MAFKSPIITITRKGIAWNIINCNLSTAIVYNWGQRNRPEETASAPASCACTARSIASSIWGAATITTTGSFSQVIQIELVENQVC